MARRLLPQTWFPQSASLEQSLFPRKTLEDTSKVGTLGLGEIDQCSLPCAYRILVKTVGNQIRDANQMTALRRNQNCGFRIGVLAWFLSAQPLIAGFCTIDGVGSGIKPTVPYTRSCLLKSPRWDKFISSTKRPTSSNRLHRFHTHHTTNHDKHKRQDRPNRQRR